MSALIKALAITGVAALFLLAVAASTQGATVGLPQSLLLLAIALIGVRYFRNDREGLIKAALICLGAGVLILPLAHPLVRALSESLIALAITGVAVYLIGPPFVRFFRLLRSGFQATKETLTRPVPLSADAIDVAGPRDFAGTLRKWQPFLIAAVICFLIAVIGGGRFIGFESASLQWNTHILTSSIVRDGAHLRDPSVALGIPASAFVAVSDSLLLSALKLIDPNAWVAFLGNLITLLNIGLFFVAAVLFLQRLSFGWTETIAAATLFLLLPLGLELRFAAPFDLSIPLLAVLPALSEKIRPAPFLAAAFATGLCNTANGYEYAALIVTLRAFNLARAQASNRIYAVAAILGILGSLIAALLLKGLAPAASLRETWWYGEEIGRIIWAENLPMWWIAIIAFAILAIGGFYALFRTRRRELLSAALTLAIAGAILGVPTQVGGIPLISLAYLLQPIAPLGWPAARLLELAAFALTIPVAYALSVVFAAGVWRSQFARGAIVWISALILFVLCLPRSQTTVLPAAAADATTVEFPIAEAGSRAGILYAEDLFARRAHVLQPLIFVNADSPLKLQSSPAGAGAVSAMRHAGVHFLVLRTDVYANPSWRTVEPRLFSEEYSAIPPLDTSYPWKIITYTPGQGG